MINFLLREKNYKDSLIKIVLFFIDKEKGRLLIFLTTLIIKIIVYKNILFFITYIF